MTHRRITDRQQTTCSYPLEAR